MDEEKFDVIVVGGGLAGSTAAYILAQQGLEVLLIERGNYAGSKNMTGGRLYAHSLEKIIPNFAEEAPVERKVVNERISMMTEKDAVTMSYHSPRLAETGSDSYVVLRGKFDRWLFDKAEEAGAMVTAGIKVDQLMVEDNRVTGVICGGEEMKADVVILADGVNSLLAEKAGLRKRVQPSHVAVGAKETYELPAKVIEDRFSLTGDEGTAWLFAGSPSSGQVGGGFLYTNKESISIGLVLGLEHITESGKTLEEMMVGFTNHPEIAPLIKDGKLLERSGHVVPEAGLSMVSTLYGDGFLICGDAAGFCLNIGYMVRGMDLAITSGELAAKAVLKAKEKGDFSSSSLQSYKEMLDNSFIMNDLSVYKNFPAFMDNPRIFNQYPSMLSGIMADMFIIDGKPALPLRKKAMKHLKAVGLLNLAKDALNGVKSV
ncbi:FAD-dependent oxidoreductase [Desulfitobacterium sp.]|uniref:FAD-dependent oxidoreductase n=1 Tax=Desulfitobacterium sp. TaxID=49981 RepID=UPI002B21E70C|nr:FAD-dependent oxidoreductase [Desulfitobacterium sp.]MEA4901395.1 FAD-dependent oxidoreductase [Desulfitobacterium sp.]